jgi:5-methylcytosine-specific restriction endonuclease McrBC GTP-binding regulatory subunit McrB
MSQFTPPKLANGKQPDQNPQSLQKQGNDKTMTSPIQKIFFGCPGTGKSYQISNDDLGGVVKEELGIDKDVHPENLIKTVFHPEYTYGDFMGKLMPQTNKDGKVSYQFYEGHFLKALGQAYKNIIEAEKVENAQNVALVIDEINRGNSSAIFGTVFQLLDRLDQPKNGIEKGWSAYGINISDLEFRKLVELIGFELDPNPEYYKYKYPGDQASKPQYLTKYQEDKGEFLRLYKDMFDRINIKVDKSKIVGSSIRIPPNLSIFGTMNTSDNSIYFMDNAFKRRWEWEYVDWSQDDDKKLDTVILEGYGNGNLKWKDLVKQFNDFIKKNHNSVRSGRIEDMQIGYRFINTGTVTENQIKNKLMFFIWDSVFNRDKNPLRKLLGDDKELVTFGDFIKYHQEFVTNLLKYPNK